MDRSDPPLQTSTKDASRGVSTDMSAEAISRRFDILQELNELCAWLGSAKPLGPVERVVPRTEERSGDE